MKQKTLTAVIAFLILVIGILSGYILKSHHEFKRLDHERTAIRSRSLPPATGYLGPWGSDPFFAQDADSWDPFQEMDQMRGVMNRMFRDSFSRGIRSGGFSGQNAISYNPEVDVRDAGREYVLRIDLPGIDKDKIDVKVQNGLLIISGERAAETEESEQNGAVYRSERSFGSFMRTMPLPADADSERMTAESSKGVLTVRIPKKDAVVESRKVNVQ